MAQQKRTPQRESLRGSGSEKNNMFNLRKGMRDVLVIVLVLNIVNVILYNTGWIDWKDDSFDTMWATGIAIADVMLIAMLSILDK